MTTAVDEKKLIALQNEALLEEVQGSFVKFLDHVYILERPQPQMGRMGGRIKFQKWPHLMEFAEDLQKYRLIDLVKARQNGFSWIISAYALWMARFYNGSLVLELSLGEKEAQALLEKAKFIYQNLPREWQLEVDRDSGSEFSLTGMKSRIVALPSTKNAGRSEQATLVIQDEADFHEYGELNYLAVKPTIDAGGQFIMASTVNIEKYESLFQNTYRGAPSNGWHKIFWGWRARPDRDDQWYRRTKEEAQDMPMAQMLGVDAYMHREYPETEEEALSPSSATAAFDLQMLKQMADGEKKPIETEEFANIYWPFRLGGKYAVGSDTAYGVGMDYSVTTVVDVRAQVVVADIMSNTLDSEEFVEASINLLRKYRNPVWCIEDNGEGQNTIKWAKKAGYSRFYKRITSRKTRLEHWHTDEVSRRNLWGDLILSVNKGQLTVPNRAGLSQFYSVIRNPKEKGRIEARSGAHDDYPLAVALALQAFDQAFSTNVNGSTAVKLW